MVSDLIPMTNISSYLPLLAHSKINFDLIPSTKNMSLVCKKTENDSKIGKSKTFWQKNIKNESCFPILIDFDLNVKTIN